MNDSGFITNIKNGFLRNNFNTTSTTNHASKLHTSINKLSSETFYIDEHKSYNNDHKSKKLFINETEKVKFNHHHQFIKTEETQLTTPLNFTQDYLISAINPLTGYYFMTQDKTTVIRVKDPFLLDDIVILDSMGIERMRITNKHQDEMKINDISKILSVNWTLLDCLVIFLTDGTYQIITINQQKQTVFHQYHQIDQDDEIKQVKAKDNIALLIYYSKEEDEYEVIMLDLQRHKKHILEVRFTMANILNHSFDFFYTGTPECYTLKFLSNNPQAGLHMYKDQKQQSIKNKIFFQEFDKVQKIYFSSQGHYAIVYGSCYQSADINASTRNMQRNDYIKVLNSKFELKKSFTLKRDNNQASSNFDIQFISDKEYSLTFMLVYSDQLKIYKCEKESLDKKILQFNSPQMLSGVLNSRIRIILKESLEESCNIYIYDFYKDPRKEYIINSQKDQHKDFKQNDKLKMILEIGQMLQTKKEILNLNHKINFMRDNFLMEECIKVGIQTLEADLLFCKFKELDMDFGTKDFIQMKEIVMKWIYLALYQISNRQNEQNEYVRMLTTNNRIRKIKQNMIQSLNVDLMLTEIEESLFGKMIKIMCLREMQNDAFLLVHNNKCLFSFNQESIFQMYFEKVLRHQKDSTDLDVEIIKQFNKVAVSFNKRQVDVKFQIEIKKILEICAQLGKKYNLKSILEYEHSQPEDKVYIQLAQNKMVDYNEALLIASDQSDWQLLHYCFEYICTRCVKKQSFNYDYSSVYELFNVNKRVRDQYFYQCTQFMKEIEVTKADRENNQADRLSSIDHFIQECLKFYSEVCDYQNHFQYLKLFGNQLLQNEQKMVCAKHELSPNFNNQFNSNIEFIKNKNYNISNELQNNILLHFKTVEEYQRYQSLLQKKEYVQNWHLSIHDQLVSSFNDHEEFCFVSEQYRDIFNSKEKKCMKQNTLEVMFLLQKKQQTNLYKYLEKDPKMYKIGLLAQMDGLKFDKIYNQSNYKLLLDYRYIPDQQKFLYSLHYDMFDNAEYFLSKVGREQRPSELCQDLILKIENFIFKYKNRNNLNENEDNVQLNDQKFSKIGEFEIKELGIMIDRLKKKFKLI